MQIKNQLTVDLKAAEVDMLTAIGESEEYQRLLKQFPILSPYIEDDYSRSKVTSSKLLGRIKAITLALEHVNAA